MGFFSSKSKSKSSTSSKQFSDADLAKLRDLVGVFSDRAKDGDMSSSLDPIIAGMERLGAEGLDVDTIMGYYEPRARESAGQSQQTVNRAVGSGLNTGKGGNALASLVSNQMSVDTERGLASKRAELEGADEQLKQSWVGLMDNIKRGDEAAMINMWNILKGSDATSNTSSSQTYKPSGMANLQSAVNFLQTGDYQTSSAQQMGLGGKTGMFSSLGSLLGMGG